MNMLAVAGCAKRAQACLLKLRQYGTVPLSMAGAQSNGWVAKVHRYVTQLHDCSLSFEAQASNANNASHERIVHQVL